MPKKEDLSQQSKLGQSASAHIGKKKKEKLPIKKRGINVILAV